MVNQFVLHIEFENEWLIYGVSDSADELSAKAQRWAAIYPTNLYQIVDRADDTVIEYGILAGR